MKTGRPAGAAAWLVNAPCSKTTPAAATCCSTGVHTQLTALLADAAACRRRQCRPLTTPRGAAVQGFTAGRAGYQVPPMLTDKGYV